MTNPIFRDVFQVLVQAVKSQANKEVPIPTNPNIGTITSRVRDFTQMNSQEFNGSEIENTLKSLLMRFIRFC